VSKEQLPVIRASISCTSSRKNVGDSQDSFPPGEESTMDPCSQLMRRGSLIPPSPPGYNQELIEILPTRE
jgi:hypothetical protein